MHTSLTGLQYMRASVHNLYRVYIYRQLVRQSIQPDWWLTKFQCPVCHFHQSYFFPKLLGHTRVHPKRKPSNSQPNLELSSLPSSLPTSLFQLTSMDVHLSQCSAKHFSIVLQSLLRYICGWDGGWLHLRLHATLKEICNKRRRHPTNYSISFLKIFIYTRLQVILLFLRNHFEINVAVLTVDSLLIFRMCTNGW